MTSRLVIRTRAYSEELSKAAASIEQAAWSDLGYLNYTRAHYENYTEILNKYADYQLCLVDLETDYPVAVFNSVPLSYTGSGDLPQEAMTAWEKAGSVALARPAYAEATAAFGAAIRVCRSLGDSPANLRQQLCQITPVLRGGGRLQLIARQRPLKPAYGLIPVLAGNRQIGQPLLQQRLFQRAVTGLPKRTVE